jgi:GxxExxY protein
MEQTWGTQMNTDNGGSRRMIGNGLSERVIGAAMKVTSTLGAGFLEKVCENALAVELRRQGHRADQQCGIDVRYEQEIVGQYLADLIVDMEMIVELKVVHRINTAHRAQCINYLRATGHRLCLLLNFGNPRLETARISL